MSAIIKGTEQGSIAEELGLECGDELLTINGEEFSDALEYGFLTAEEKTDLCIKKKNNEIIIYEVEKDEYEDIGIIFETSLIDEPRSCRNKCIFCFIDQLPKNLRSPLYFKDDDTRLSFLNGNYVTLTNVNDKQLDKIIRMKLSPINVSVHTTDDRLRIYMLNNKKAGNILGRVKKLTDGGITVNCQIVLVKNVNDKDALVKTVTDLSALYPQMHSISVVPVGLSDHRKGLYPIEDFTHEDACEIVKTLEKLQKDFLKKFSSRIVYIADELYIKAEKEIPPSEDYEDFPQIENGVGMIASFLKNVNLSINDNITENKTQKTIVTGKCSCNYIKKAVNTVEKKYKSVKINVVTAENKLFGKKITVSGLLCGRDILDSIKDIEIGDALIIPRDTLRAQGDIFLDDMTVEEFEKKVGVPVYFASSDGSDFVKLCIK